MRNISITIGAVVLATAALAVWGLSGLTRHVIFAIDRWGDSGADFQRTLQQMNGKDGTIAEIDKLVLALKSTTVHIDMAARHEDKQLATLDNEERVLFSDLHGTAQDVRRAVSSATETSRAATVAIQTTNESLEHLKPFLDASTHTIQTTDIAIESLNKRINDPSLDRILNHVQSITESGDGIVADAKLVSDKATKDYLSPKPWWEKAEKYFSDVFDLGALVARHTP